MSVETWEKEFIGEINPKMTDKQMLDHTKQKFSGLTEANLKKHKVILKEDFVMSEKLVRSGKDVYIGRDNCAFCLKSSNADGVRDCSICFITKSTGKSCSDNGSLYWLFIEGQMDLFFKEIDKLYKKIRGKK